MDCPGRCAGAGKGTGGGRGGRGTGVGRGGTTWLSGGADCPRRGAGAGRGVDGGRADGRAAERTAQPWSRNEPAGTLIKASKCSIS